MFVIRWRGPLCNRTDLCRIHLNVVLGDNEPQEGDRGDMQFALLSLHKELVGEKTLEITVKMLNVTLFVWGKIRMSSK